MQPPNKALILTQYSTLPMCQNSYPKHTCNPFTPRKPQEEHVVLSPNTGANSEETGNQTCHFSCDSSITITTPQTSVCRLHHSDHWHQTTHPPPVFPMTKHKMAGTGQGRAHPKLPPGQNMASYKAESQAKPSEESSQQGQGRERLLRAMPPQAHGCLRGARRGLAGVPTSRSTGAARPKIAGLGLAPAPKEWPHHKIPPHPLGSHRRKRQQETNGGPHCPAHMAHVVSWHVLRTLQ